jgi:hypothetical protein
MVWWRGERAEKEEDNTLFIWKGSELVVPMKHLSGDRKKSPD